MRFEVKQEGERIRVFDTKLKNYITIDVPTMEIAEEIAADFNAMDVSGYAPMTPPKQTDIN